MRNNAKVICTIGPATSSREVVFGLIRGGMDVARLNFSHGDHASHGKTLRLIREGEEKYNRPVAVLGDLQGIKIRTGPAANGAVMLKKARGLIILAGEGLCDESRIYVSYPALIRDARPGDRILLDDGLIELRVTGKNRKHLAAVVVEGGLLRDRKGVNLPGMKISARALTEKDKADMDFALRIGVDYIAVSFVRTAEDVKSVRGYIENKRHHASVPLIAKIEKPEALKNIDSIIEEADGIMVARGDLGVEVPPEDVPLIQKSLIEIANRKGKLVITATQMLESMTSHSRPTRAEATDVANAVIDGTDALMLSAETSTGKYPLKALLMMEKIIRHTEGGKPPVSQYRRGKSFSEAVADAAVHAAEDIGARYIAAFTRSGYTARLISKFRPRAPIAAFSPSESVRRRMALYWGVIPLGIGPLRKNGDVIDEVVRLLLKEGMARQGDNIAITASAPLLGEGKTNFLKLHRIGGS